MDAKELGYLMERKRSKLHYMGIFQTPIVPIHYHSFYGRERAYEIEQILYTYDEFFHPLLDGELEAIILTEGGIEALYDGINLHLPTKTSPYTSKEFYDSIVSAMDLQPNPLKNDENHDFQKVYVRPKKNEK